MKISTTKKAAILATVLSGFVLGSSAEAAKLGIVTASDYVTSHMGAIEGSLINSNDITAIKSVITGLNRDPAVYNTVDQATGESSIYIRQYNYSTTNLQNSYAFNGQDWSNKVAGNTSGAVNAHDVARYKDFVYVASYDEGTIGVAQVTSGENGVISDKTAFTRNLKSDLTKYGKLTFSDKAQLHGEGVVILDGNLYVVANCNPEGGYDPYSPSYLIKYVIKEDGRLSYDGYTTMGKNTDSVALNVYNNYMLATAIGGYQFYGAENSNADTSIDVVTLKTENNKFLNTRKITLPENLLQVRDGQTIPKSEFRSLKVMPNGTAYVMTYNIGTAGKNVDVTVYQTTISNLLSKNPENWKVIVEEKAAPGWFGRLDAEQNTKRLWVQIGNKLNIYTDGATEAESFGTDSFASNPMYEELYTWDIISTDVIPEGGLVNLHITKGNVKPVAWKEVELSKNIGQIKNETYKNIETKDNLISLNQDDEGNLTNNVLAGIYADGVASTIIANDGLQIQVDNNIASPVGIYAGNGGSVKFTSTSGNLDILTKTLEGGNTVTNAIWLDPSKTGGEKLQITAANTNITMEGGYGGNGIAIQKTDRWGENSKESAKGGNITIQGNVNIKGADSEGNADWGIEGNPTNVLSRFNNAGILVDVNNSSVEVNGNVDMDVYGNGVTVTGDNSTVTLKKGGTITVPTGTDYGYYALAAYDGTINMNADATANAVKLNGDIFATSEGTVNLGLATGDSYLKGIIDNGGTANLTLINGAKWYNEANNTRYAQDNEDKGSNGRSHVTTLKGGTTFDDAGTIIQTANSKNLWVDNLTGAVKVKYDSYDVGENVTVNGGNVTIDTAEAGSLVGLYAPNKGFGADDTDTVNAVLNALANKLYYNGYMQRDTGLQGYVLIGEGITSSSIGQYAQEINFTNNGQGTTNGEGTGINPDDGNEDDGSGDGEGGEVEREPFTPVAYPVDVEGNANAVWQNNADYIDGVTIDSSSSNISVGTGNVLQIQKEDDKSFAVVHVAELTKTKSLKNTKTDMNIIAKANGDKVRANAIWFEPSASGGGKLILSATNMSSQKNVNISILGGYGGNGIAISRADGSKKATSSSQISLGGNLVIKGISDDGKATWGISANPENYDARTNNAGILVEVDKAIVKNGTGKVDMAVYGNGITVDGAGASVELKNGGNIIVPTDTENNLNYYSLAAYDGTIKFGWKEPNNNYQVTNNGTIIGNLFLGSSTAEIDLAMNGANSELKGAVINNNGGNAWLFLTNGAKWTNVSNNTNEIGAVSHLTKLDAHYDSGTAIARIIQTPDSGDIIIDAFGGGGEVRGNATTNPGKLRVEYELDENSPTMIKGGSIVIEDAFKGSQLTVYTPYNDKVTKDNLWNVFNGLANKIYYHGAKYLTDAETGEVLFDENGNPRQIDGDGSLNAYVQMGEGLTASSISAVVLANKGILKDGVVSDDIDDIEYATNGTLNAVVKWNGLTGQGSLTGELEDGTGFYEASAGNDAFVNANGAYTKPIYGTVDHDGDWVIKGVTKGDGIYNFTDAVTVFETYNKKIDGGAWHSAVGVAISAHGSNQMSNTIVNLNNKDLVITNTTQGSGASITAIDGGIVQIKDAGNIIINENGHGPTAGIFANSGGEVYIDNVDGGIVTIRTSAGGGGGTETGYGESGAGIKTMNGVKDVRSKVVITGLVDIVADLNTCNNEAISSVASTIEVGGGNIQAINGAWAAIRAYGEFVSDNASVVNVNVIKQTDADGNILKDPNDSNVDLIAGAGDNKTTIYGDFVTNGGMGTKGNISVGLGTADSYWIGNYGDTRGYGVTQGMEGEVNLYMKNGASWTGFTDGEMNVTMEGEGTTWLGYNVAERQADAVGNVNGGLVLTLKDSAVWKNAITTEQKYGDTVQDAKVYDFNGDGGFIDMTGNKTFIGKNSAYHAEGSNGVSFKNTSIIFNDTPQETGNLVITNYSGDTTVIYRHDTTDVTNILGGTTTIKKASAGSNITLSTDSTGIDMTNTTQVTNVLDNLAEKLFYTAYTTGERNLSGKVQIAEGLTTSSVGKYTGKIEFNGTEGQGSMVAGSLAKPVDPTVPPSGDEDIEKPEDKPVVPEVKPEDKPVVEETIKGAITGDSLTNTTDGNPYKDLIGKDDKDNAVIDFGKLDKEDSKVDIVKIESEEEGGNNSVIAAAPSESVIIDVAGKDLAVNGSATSEALGIQAIGGDVTIKDAGYITITADAGETGSASAIYAKGGEKEANVTIENSDTVKLIANGNADGAVLHADTNSNVNIEGKVEITDTNGKVAVEVAKDSTVALGGGVIGDKGNVAIAVKNGGSIVINKEGGQSVVINGKILLGDPQSKMMMMKVAPKAIEVPAGASSFNLTDDQSSMNGDVQYTGSGNNAFVAGISNGAKWTGNSVGGVDLDVILADGGAWTGYHDDNNTNAKLDMQISNGATWTNTATDETTINSLTGATGEGAKTGYINMSENTAADLTVKEYSGETTFVYANNYGEEGKDLVQGGTVKIEAAADGSIATMRTNNIGTSKQEEVKKVLDALAQKLIYADYGQNPNNLTGKVQIMEGMTTSSATREGKIAFDKDGKGSLDTSKEVTVDYTGDYIYGDSETAMMKGAKSAMASTVMMWRSESNDLLQRIGDVRLATEESGVWAKYYGGKYEMDAQNTNFSTNYKAYQVGYDKAVGNGWNVGVAVSHNEGDSRYDRGGEGEMTVTSLSVYGNKDYGDGRYLGLILKGSQLKNEYEVFNNDGYKLEGDFKTWGTSISAEYGKRIEKGNGFYFDPSVELTIGHVQGKDYTATSDLLADYGKTATMQVEQDDFNSIIGRVGFGIGQRTDKASYYAKLALAHEFGGDFDTHYTAEETKGTSISFGDTWYEMQLGGTAKLSDNSLLYATYERSFGGDVTEKWRVDAGLRVTF